MEILKDNFQELLPTIEKAIKEADFIALDTELTGLNDRIEQIKIFDDPQSRFTKVRTGATKFLIIQFGLCTFTYSEADNTFVARPFNFYIFPANADRKDFNDLCFLCSGSSLQFLSKCGFDFNKLIKKGIPWLNRTNERKLTIRRENFAQRQIDNPLDEETKLHVDNALKLVEAWVENPLAEELVIETPSIRQKRLLLQETRERFDGFIVGDSRQKSVMFRQISQEERQKRIDEAAEEAATSLINFRVVIELMVAAKKPVVGHNCFLDFCQFINQFWEEIPERIRDWKQMVHEMFEIVIDTKHIASSHRKLQKILPKTGVQDILQAVEKSPFTEHTPKIVLDPAFNRYTFNDETYLHEAGYDAYITGHIFISLTAFMLHQSEEKIDAYSSVFDDSLATPEIIEEASTILVESNFLELLMTSEKLTNHYNKLHLMRSDFKYINLVGLDGMPQAKPNSFLLSNIPPMTKQQTLFTIFEEFGSIFFSWIDDTHCWLTVRDDQKRAKLVEGSLKKSKYFAKYMEGGSKHEKGKDKCITVATGNIIVKSWNTWIKEITNEDEKNISEEIPVDGEIIKVDKEIQTEVSIEGMSEIAFSLVEPELLPSSWSYPPVENEWPPNSAKFQSWSKDGTDDNWVKNESEADKEAGTDETTNSAVEKRRLSLPDTNSASNKDEDQEDDNIAKRAKMRALRILRSVFP
ncbi:hypothetical protein G9A89_008096 [Geosiphon pyriformis]|nr:hypothetical protein G9A89_008096 [Geosiphon pyriformis]